MIKPAHFVTWSLVALALAGLGQSAPMDNSNNNYGTGNYYTNQSGSSSNYNTNQNIANGNFPAQAPELLSRSAVGGPQSLTDDQFNQFLLGDLDSILETPLTMADFEVDFSAFWEFEDHKKLKAYLESLEPNEFQTFADIVDHTDDAFILSNNTKKAMMFVYLSEKQRRNVQFSDRDRADLPLLKDWVIMIRAQFLASQQQQPPHAPQQ
ncbi:hypothetical protein H4R33_000587 [Dimargaris cristalligena]|uniref:Uncharacterized protein n=1 Tax=Dimargaris cristalligena TaxID=215637 RepID=A0A4Q0A1C1_9FUNG|nr:hypothetical protein H4R33_000587 [Dimargaris cristalligena]RKP39827.1 hypothetical protein BJ085DRAFT_33380 [Dimargaris cristalligena]|eukprot:RKP39827.1 hypothetical protein BJ085DRAFT_33380 [Dimargaris cristalligena]